MNVKYYEVPLDTIMGPWAACVHMACLSEMHVRICMATLLNIIHTECKAV